MKGPCIRDIVVDRLMIDLPPIFKRSIKNARQVEKIIESSVLLNEDNIDKFCNELISYDNLKFKVLEKAHIIINFL
jgi:hypothetical protein